MNTSKNTINAAAVLNTLNPESVAALEVYFRSEILSTLTATLGAPAIAAAETVETDSEAPAAKRGPGRPKKTPVGTEVVEAPAAKRGPGRPKKVTTETDEEAPAKRGPGRPKKVEAELGPSGRAKKAAKAEKTEPTPRALTKDGRTASQVVRDFDERYNAKHEEEAPAADVIAYCAKVGLEDVKASLVYNVRKNVKNAAEAEALEAAKAARKAAKAAKK